MRRRDRFRDDSGAYLILYALLVTGLFTVAAIVLDLAALRHGRRADRMTADLASTAGASAIDLDDASTFSEACGRAWGYVLANRTEADGAIVAPSCGSTFPSGVPCTATTGARTAAGSIGDIEIEITHPVPDSSPSMLAEAQGGDQPQAVDPATDGGQCERIGVRIVRRRQFLFGQIAGTTGATTDVHSVARVLLGNSATDVPGIVALERTGCDGIAATPTGGRLDVAGVGFPGTAIVDSDGSACPTPGFTIAPAVSSQFRARPAGAVPGAISSFALSGTNFARAYDQAAVNDGRLSPTPTPVGNRTGRAIIEQRYNCTSGCPVGSDQINQLRASLLVPGGPPGFTPYAGPCAVPPGPPVLISGNTFVNCPVFEVFGSLTFSAPTVVFSGDVIVRGGGCLGFNTPSCGAAGSPATDGVAFLAGGLSKEPDSTLALPRTFVYSGGVIDLPLGNNPSSELTWSAPLAGPLQDLLLWTETTANPLIAEQRTTLLEGTVYAPNATVVLEGRVGGGDLVVALQVVSNRVRLQGSGDVVLAPVGARATGRLTRQTRLVR